MKKLRKALSILLTLCLLASFGLAAVAAGDDGGLKAGAGIAVMDFSPEILKAAVYRGSDGFNGETHDPLHARALVLDDGETRVVVVSLEMLIVPSVMSRLKAAVSEIAEIDQANVWINCTHVITSPHNSGGADADLDAEYDQVIINATKAAAADAVASLKPATMSIGTATLDINANRNIATPDGVEPSNTHYGMDKNGDHDTTMTMLRFDGADGKPISVFISYAIKPTALDNAGQSATARVVSSDVPGYACNMLEKEFQGAVCLFGLPAAADQVPEKTALYWDFDQSTEKATDFGVEYGLQIVEDLGTKMGTAAISLAKGQMKKLDNTKIAVAQTSFATTKTDGSATDIAISGLAIGDVALVGYGPELNNATGKQVIAASPYEYTLMLAFTNGHGDYMPNAAAFDYQNGRGTFETSRSGYEQGAAEKFVTAAGQMLNGMYGASDIVPTSQTIFIDGARVDLKAYMSNGHNYVSPADLGARINMTLDADRITAGALTVDGGSFYKLRDLANDFGFGVTYEGETDSVIVRSGGLEITGVSNWECSGNVSVKAGATWRLEKNQTVKNLEIENGATVTADSPVVVYYESSGDVVSGDVINNVQFVCV